MASKRYQLESDQPEKRAYKKQDISLGSCQENISGSSQRDKKIRENVLLLWKQNGDLDLDIIKKRLRGERGRENRGFACDIRDDSPFSCQIWICGRARFPDLPVQKNARFVIEKTIILAFDAACLLHKTFYTNFRFTRGIDASHKYVSVSDIDVQPPKWKLKVWPHAALPIRTFIDLSSNAISDALENPKIGI